jgi:hypothetical protein
MPRSVPEFIREPEGAAGLARANRRQTGHSAMNVICHAGCSAMRLSASALASAFVANDTSGQGLSALVKSNEMTRQLVACSVSANRRLLETHTESTTVARGPMWETSR